MLTFAPSIRQIDVWLAVLLVYAHTYIYQRAGESRGRSTEFFNIIVNKKN